MFGFMVTADGRTGISSGSHIDSKNRRVDMRIM